jgi:small redox-active disulfide protein 2
MKRIKVLGPGCPKCERVAEHARQAAEEAGVECELEKVTDMDAILAHGVMMTPGLVIDGEVKAAGKVPSAEEIRDWLTTP